MRVRFLLALILTPLVHAQSMDMHWSSSIGSARFETTATPEQLKSTTKWTSAKINGRQQTLEPKGSLSLTEAITLADKRFQELVKAHDPDNANHWIMSKAERAGTSNRSIYYLVKYRELNPSNTPGRYIPQRIQLIILLDGTILPLNPITKDKSEMNRSYIEVKWEGASAEEIAAELKPLTDHAAISIIDDGFANLYFDFDAREANMKWNDLMRRAPKGLKIMKLGPTDRPIPDAPKQKDSPILDYQLQQERIAEFGLTAAKVSKQLSEILSQGKPTAEALKAAAIDGPGGAKIPLKDIVHIQQVMRKRPLVIKN